MAQAQRRTVPLVPDGRGFALDVDALRRRRHAANEGVDHQLATQSDRHGAQRRPNSSAIAEVAVDADLLVITDEVYEHLVFDNRRHLPLAGYPGMADRTVTISSAAKMFNCTGWKIGWACGDADLIAGVRAAKQYLSYVGGAPFQPAVAQALRHRGPWVASLRDALQAKRDKLAAALASIGFDVHDSGGTYFLCADPRPLGYHDSTTFCAELPQRAGVAAIPMSAFCDPAVAHAGAWNHLVRFAFCKRDDTMDEAIRRPVFQGPGTLKGGGDTRPGGARILFRCAHVSKVTFSGIGPFGSHGCSVTVSATCQVPRSITPNAAIDHLVVLDLAWMGCDSTHTTISSPGSKTVPRPGRPRSGPRCVGGRHRS